MPINKDVLEKLKINDGNLVDLDLSCQGVTLSDVHALVCAIANNNKLKTLNLSGNDIGNAGAHLLAQTSHITSLNLTATQIGNEGAVSLSKNPMFTSLILVDNQISLAGAQALADNKTLLFLDLSNNYIYDESATVLARNTTLSSLNLAYNKVGVKGAEAFRRNNTLLTLDLSHNVLCTEGAIALAHNTTLRTLIISENKISDHGITFFSQNTALTALDLSFNQVCDEGAIDLAKHPSLVYLNLSYNRIGFLGANALSNNNTLIELVISYNMLGDNGAIALANNKRIERLNLTGNHIGFKGAHALSANAVLKSLVLSFNLLNDEAALALARNTNLSILSLSHNEIGEAGAIALAQNAVLNKLCLHYNNIGEQGRRALSQNKRIEFIYESHEKSPALNVENLHTIFSLSENFVCVTSREGKIQFFNPVFSKTLGYDEDELLTKNLFDLLHPEDKNEYLSLLKFTGTLPIRNFENRYLCKNGAYRFVRWSIQTRCAHIFTVGIDVTEQKKSQNELKNSQDSSADLRLHQSNIHSQKQAEFIAQLSHEIRNPLNGIYGLIDVLREQIRLIQGNIGNSSESSQVDAQEKIDKPLAIMTDALDNMTTCVDHQKSILDDNLDLARIAENKLILHKRLLSLNKIIQIVTDMTKASATKKGLTINNKLPEEEIEIIGDERRLQQILLNLVSNAIKFTVVGKIDIVLTTEEIAPSHFSVKIEIIDSGPGLSEEESLEIFKRFSQVSGSQYDGSALGLYFVKELVTIMGGIIQVESEKDKGTIFRMIIPFEKVSFSDRKENKQKKAGLILKQFAINPPISSIKMKILIVEDNEINRKVLGNHLKKVGCEFEVAHDGLEALVAFNKQKFDVILMDVIMPNMDGITAAKEIRKLERERGLTKTPIIIVTANALESDRAEALSIDIQGYIIKPFKKEELYQKLNDLHGDQTKISSKAHPGS